MALVNMLSLSGLGTVQPKPFPDVHRYFSGTLQEPALTHLLHQSRNTFQTMSLGPEIVFEVGISINEPFWCSF